MHSVWRSVRSLPGWLQVLLVGQFVNAAGALAWIYLTLYLVDSRDLSTSHAGVLTAVNGGGLILGNLIGGGVGDRVGLRRALIGGLVGWAICCSLVPMTPVPLLAPLLLAAGTLGGFARPLMSAVTLAALPTADRRTGAALWRATFNAGSILGPPLGAVAAAHHFGVIFAVDAVSSLVLAGLVWAFAPGGDARVGRRRSTSMTATPTTATPTTATPTTATPTTATSTTATSTTATPTTATPTTATPTTSAPSASLLSTLRRSPFTLAVLGTVIFVDTSYRQLYVGLPLELHQLHAPTIVYGLTVTLNCVLIVVAEVWVALRMAHRSPGAVVVGGYLLVGASWLVFGAHPGIATAIALVVIISVGEMLYKPTATAAVADAAPPGYEGRYQSLYAAASISGTVLAPGIGGMLFQHHPGALWLGGAVLPIAAAAVLLRAARREVPIDADGSVAVARALSGRPPSPATPEPRSRGSALGR